MNRRTSTSTQPAIRQRPSLPHGSSSSFLRARPRYERRPSAISIAELGHDERVVKEEDAVHEEIAEIKRYEVKKLLRISCSS